MAISLLVMTLQWDLIGMRVANIYADTPLNTLADIHTFSGNVENLADVDMTARLRCD